MRKIVGRSIALLNGHRPRRLALASLVLASVSFAVAGCVSSSSPSPPPSNSTVVVPGGTTVICSDGTSPPCR